MRAKLAPWGGWQRCLHLSNGALDLVLTLDVGPRLISLRFQGGPEELAQLPQDLGKSGGSKYRFYGGHRLWYAPEKTPYPLDNRPIHLRIVGSAAYLIQPIEPETGLQKQWTLRLHPRLPKLSILHRLLNRGRRAHRVAPWALTVLKPGGDVILPLPERAPFPKKLLPAGPLVLWPYTDLADRRWRFGARLLRFRADPRNRRAQKLGLWSSKGWIAYLRGRRLLVIRAKPRPGKPYPDQGCNVETWGRGNMVELETLGPLQELRPGQSLSHAQTWELRRLHPGLGESALERRIRGMA